MEAPFGLQRYLKRLKYKPVIVKYLRETLESIIYMDSLMGSWGPQTAQ